MDKSYLDYIFNSQYNPFNVDNIETTDSFIDKFIATTGSGMTNGDEKKIQELLENIVKYDKYEFLLRVSALRLPYKNRDKAVLIDAITTATLNWLDVNDWNFEGIPMSYGKFKKVINYLNQMDSKRLIDPIDNPYLDSVQFYGNYEVMPGINTASSYNLMMVIQSLFLSQSYKITDEEKQNITQLLHENLAVSTKICKKISFTEEPGVFTRDIFIPGKDIMDNYIKCIQLETCSKDIAFLVIEPDDYTHKHFSAFSQDSHIFLKKPYINTPRGIIVLDATSIANALYKEILKMLPDDFRESVFNEIWKDVRKSLRSLGHNRISSDSLGIKLMNEGNYKEGIFNVVNDKLLVVFSLFSGVAEKVDFSEKMSNRLSVILNKLKDDGVKQDQIFIICIAHSLGGEVSISLRKGKGIGDFPFANFNAMEIRAVSYVENDDIFLPRFMRAKNRLREPEMLSSFGDFMATIRFSENDMSFYVSDDVDHRQVIIHLEIEETSGYYLKANKKNNSRIFLSDFDENWYVAIKEEHSNRYFCELKSDKLFRCFITSNSIIEIVTDNIKSPEEMDILFNAFDLVSYWLDQYHSVIEIEKNYIIYLKLQSDPDEYFTNSLDSFGCDPLLEINFNENLIVWAISPQLYQSIGMSETNESERKLLEVILKIINEDLDEVLLDSLFYPEYKKKMTGLILDENGMVRVPTQGFDLLRISGYEINQMLDEIGEYLANQGHAYGKIPQEDNSNFCNDIVYYLYSILEKETKKFNKRQLLEVLVAQLETLLPMLLRGEASYNNDILLSPHEKSAFHNQIEDNNKNSISTRFLLEYVVASPFDGDRNIGRWEIERLLTICSLIIEWAHRSDYFKYNFVDSTMSFLVSNRIGIKKRDFDKVNLAMLNLRNMQLESSQNTILIDKKYMERIEMLLDKELNQAFVDAFNYSYSEFDEVLSAMVSIYGEKKQIVFQVEKKELVKNLYEFLKEQISKQKIMNILNEISLSEREDYLLPPDGFEKLDIFPWRFNRRLSFLRRPLLDYNEYYFFGVRNIIHARKYLLNLIWEGRLKTESKCMKDLMARLSNILGDEFNDRVKRLIETFPDLQVSKGVSKIGKKHITDENNKTLGDVDVFVINQNRKKIYLIETKDFSFSRNPYEISKEQEKVFSGRNPFLAKHLKRADWIKRNLGHVLCSYGLPEGNWRVETMFIVSEHLITRDLQQVKQAEFVSFKEINGGMFK